MIKEITTDPARPNRARQDRAMQAAVDSVDPTRLLPSEGASVAEVDRLLPGEDPNSGHAEDAEHWIAVYSELLDFKRFMLDGAAARARDMSTDEARAEVLETDLVVARAEAERFARRLAYWRTRGDLSA